MLGNAPKWGFNWWGIGEDAQKCWTPTVVAASTGGWAWSESFYVKTQASPFVGQEIHKGPFHLLFLGARLDDSCPIQRLGKATPVVFRRIRLGGQDLVQAKGGSPRTSLRGGTKPHVFPLPQSLDGDAVEKGVVHESGHLDLQGSSGIDHVIDIPTEVIQGVCLEPLEGPIEVHVSRP